MNPSQWKAKLGENSWNQLMRAYVQAPISEEDEVAAVLTQATQLGFSFPEAAPVVNPKGTSLLWPNGKATITADGLAEHYRLLGHGFLLIRVPQLLKACAPTQLLARLQEIMGLYEMQCEADGVETLPEPACSRVFVGGKAAHSAIILGTSFMAWLKANSPPPPDPASIGVAKATREAGAGRAD